MKKILQRYPHPVPSTKHRIPSESYETNQREFEKALKSEKKTTEAIVACAKKNGWLPSTSTIYQKKNPRALNIRMWKSEEGKIDKYKNISLHNHTGTIYVKILPQRNTMKEHEFENEDIKLKWW